MRECTKCGKCGEFGRDAQKPDGLDRQCKICRRQASSDYRLRNLEIVQKKDRVRRKLRYQRNPSADNMYAINWQKTHPDAVRMIKKRSRVKNRFKRYGITAEEYASIIFLQNGNCAICYQSLTGKWNQHIDHNHENGKVRGVLCAKCNRGLGHFNDNANLLEMAAAYLRGYDDEY